MMPEVLAVEHDEPGARAEHRRARRRQVAQRLAEPLALDAERHRRRLTAGQDEPVEPLEVGRHADLADLGAERAQHGRVRGEVALQGEDADGSARTSAADRPDVTSRGWRASARARACAPRGSAWRSPRPSDARATRSGSAKCVVASTMAARADRGVLGLEDARADEHGLRAELHHRATRRPASRCRRRRTAATGSWPSRAIAARGRRAPAAPWPP